MFYLTKTKHNKRIKFIESVFNLSIKVVWGVLVNELPNLLQ